MKLHKSSPSQFSLSTCLPPLLLPSLLPHSKPTCRLHHLPDSHSPSHPTFFAVMTIVHHLPMLRTQIWIKRIHSSKFSLLRRSVRSNTSARLCLNCQLWYLPLSRPPPLLLLLPLLPLLLPCLPLLLPLPPPLLLHPPLLSP